ncbi:alpha-galactosidase [Gayadomonas joobiniege]|uniref:alpha-galactosidase n=1 Tax=Gayadomonas joobiniege TaxID=1234606 RepID=UPI000368940D|nr:alpha-galactosidase [Gayadomonas joobiniege]
MKRLLIALTLLIFNVSVFADLPKLEHRFGEAYVLADNDTLIVSTGRFERQWQLVDTGLATRLVSFGERVQTSQATTADWNYPGWITAETKADLVSLTAEISDDDQFTSPHINLIAEFNYPSIKTQIRYQIWVYPDAEGVRTQLWVKGQPVVAKQTEKGPQLKLLKGKQIEHGFRAKKQLAIRIEELAANQYYRAKIFASEQVDVAQSIVLTSLDNEFKIEPPEKLNPGGSLALDLPEALRPDGTVTLLVSSSKQATTAIDRIEIEAWSAANTQRKKYTFPSRSINNTFDREQRSMSARVDFVPVSGQQIVAAGYYNDTQHRHTLNTPLIKEQQLKNNDQVDWASLLFVEDHSNGFALVKESPKCVNQPSVDTGRFVVNKRGVETTGWGISRANIKKNEWRWAWATWNISYAASSQAARELALKQFHRTRFPVDAKLDLYTKANTWGSGNGGTESKQFAKESEVLAEIRSVSALGLDALQIDDGWQTGRMPSFNGQQSAWQVRPDWYPQGWKNVVAQAKKYQIQLGIWHAAKAPLKDLKHNFDQAKFTTWKLDFANLSKYEGAYNYLNKARQLIRYSDHQLRVNWDVTENAPRFGYYWASEAGNLWLANRKPETPVNVIPKPSLMLREVWQIARYLNLNKIELPVVNFAMVNQQASDAYLHSTEYATALGLPGIPVFFQTTRLLTQQQRDETKKLLNVYKKHRNNLFNGYVFPLGKTPDGKSITGFQWFNPVKPNESYLLLFRERLSKQAQTQIELNFLPKHSNWQVENLLGKQAQKITVKQGNAKVFIKEAGDIAFVRLERAL